MRDPRERFGERRFADFKLPQPRGQVVGPLARLGSAGAADREHFSHAEWSVLHQSGARKSADGDQYEQPAVMEVISLTSRVGAK